jgi:site-specific recombinase XerC
MKRRANALINRRNWKDTREYLDYCRDVRQCCDETINLYRAALDRLLRWATSTPLPHTATLRPTFPHYLTTLNLSPAYIVKTLSVTRAFFLWMRTAQADRYGALPAGFVESLVSRRREGEIKERDFFTVEDVFALVDVEPATLAEQRDRAAVAFLFLSGMRDAAFCSLPIKAVDFDALPPRVKQWPALGVRTKFGKAANTMLLLEPSRLLEIARRWDALVREALPGEALWYAQMEPSGETFAVDQTPGQHRTFAKRLRQLCERAQVDVKSPHKLRNGHILFALDRCRDMADLKAVSQNVMHDSIKTTESVYGRLNEERIAQRLIGMTGDVQALFGQNRTSVLESSLHTTG